MSHKGTILGPGGFVRDGATVYVVAVIDLDAAEPEPRLIGIDFLGHGVAVDPARPWEAAVFEKKGPGACRVDLRDGTLLEPIRTASNRHFYGHGAYSADGSLLYATESVLDDGQRGVLVVRDARTLAELGEVPTYGTAPHDCHLLADGKTMLVANGGGRIGQGALPSVSYVDVASEALVDRVELVHERFNAGHVAITAAGDLAVVSAPREGLPDLHRQLGAVTLVKKGVPALTIERPQTVTERMLGEALSVAIHEPSGVVVATHPDGNMVSLWHMPDASLAGRLDALTEPRGVTLTLDGRYFVVSHRIEGNVVLTMVPTDTLKPSDAGRVAPSFTSGSHIFVHDLAAA
jgi:uncharacterized protein